MCEGLGSLRSMASSCWKLKPGGRTLLSTMCIAQMFWVFLPQQTTVLGTSSCSHCITRIFNNTPAPCAYCKAFSNNSSKCKPNTNHWVTAPSLLNGLSISIPSWFHPLMHVFAYGQPYKGDEIWILDAGLPGSFCIFEEPIDLGSCVAYPCSSYCLSRTGSRKCSAPEVRVGE